MGACKSTFSFINKEIPCVEQIIKKLKERVGSDLLIEDVSKDGCIIEHERMNELLCLSIDFEIRLVTMSNFLPQFRYLGFCSATVLYEFGGSNEYLSTRIPKYVNRKLDDIKWWHFIPL